MWMIWRVCENISHNSPGKPTCPLIHFLDNIDSIAQVDIITLRPRFQNNFLRSLVSDFAEIIYLLTSAIRVQWFFREILLVNLGRMYSWLIKRWILQTLCLHGLRESFWWRPVQCLIQFESWSFSCHDHPMANCHVALAQRSYQGNHGWSIPFAHLWSWPLDWYFHYNLLDYLSSLCITSTIFSFHRGECTSLGLNITILIGFIYLLFSCILFSTIPHRNSNSLNSVYTHMMSKGYRWAVSRRSMSCVNYYLYIFFR